MRIHKRKRASRWRGSHTHGRGFKKKARGLGHQGGKGMAGTGKRGKAKKTLVLNLYGNDYFGKDKALRKGQAVVKPLVLNLQQISDNLQTYISEGVAKDNKGMYEFNLKEYKILGDGELIIKANIQAHSASQSAIDKVKKAGGQIIVKEIKDIVTPTKDEIQAKKDAASDAKPVVKKVEVKPVAKADKPAKKEAKK